MTLQRRLFQAMLVLLGLAAAAGVATIFLPSATVVGRAAATLLAAGITLAVAVQASRPLADPKRRPIGLLALTLVVPAFCLALAAIWLGLWNRDAWTTELAGTTACYVAMAMALVCGFVLWRNPRGKLSGAVLAACGVVAFGFAVVAIWQPFGPRRSFGSEPASTAWLLAVFGPVAAACMYGAVQKRQLWPWLGAAGAVAGLALGVTGVWIVHSHDSTWFQQCWIIACPVGIANSLTCFSLRGNQRVVLWLTLASISAAALCCTYINLASSGFQTYQLLPDLPTRLLAASTILSVCGMLAIAVLLAANKRAPAAASRAITDLLTISLTCPRCGNKGSTPVGASRCSGCGLLFSIQLAEPRCVTCEYSLLDIRGGVCPECGTPIPDPAAVAAGARQ
ncbi:MAG: hypothetical protein ACKVS8_07600 [Phycisphaerales bacterium]